MVEIHFKKYTVAERLLLLIMTTLAELERQQYMCDQMYACFHDLN